jgi:hypothetical protein
MVKGCNVRERISICASKILSRLCPGLLMAFPE